MKVLRSVAAHGVAVLAISSALAASASAALPEFSEPFPKPFEAKSGLFIAEAAGEEHDKFECTTSTGTGHVVGAQTGTVTLVLKGCLGEHNKEKFPCTTPGAAKEGEIVTGLLPMTLGYINREKRQVGLVLGAPAIAAATFAEFECELPVFGSIPFVWEGSVIGKLTPVNKKVKPAGRFTLNFTEAAGKQKPIKLEGGPKDILTSYLGYRGSPEHMQIGLSAKDEIAFGEAVEVKA